MNRIYVDNAATTFPKPDTVSRAICNYIENVGANVGRGTYESSYDAARVVYETREQLAEMFNYKEPMNVVFTMNITDSINTLLKGFLIPGDEVIISSMEHNAVIRTLNSKVLAGVNIIKLQCDIFGTLDTTEIEKNISSNTKLIIMTHASNVCGTILPIKEVGEISKKYSIPFILDSAQSAGVLDIDMEAMNLSALAFTGHKGLLGPQGIGGFIINDKLAEATEAFRYGGTGSYSELEEQPSILPDKFESGTLNIPGIYGLNAALKYIKTTGIRNIRNHEMRLSKLFLEGILNIKGISLSGINGVEGRTAVFSLNFDKMDNSEAAFILDREYGIMTRVGLHCAPSAHKTLGTFPKGSVRISFGLFNTEQEVEYIISSINKLLK
jgi:cysteine desulfurase family protein